MNLDPRILVAAASAAYESVMALRKQSPGVSWDELHWDELSPPVRKRFIAQAQAIAYGENECTGVPREYEELFTRVVLAVTNAAAGSGRFPVLDEVG
jgi:hypothetical protein